MRRTATTTFLLLATVPGCLAALPPGDAAPPAGVIAVGPDGTLDLPDMTYADGIGGAGASWTPPGVDWHAPPSWRRVLTDGGVWRPLPFLLDPVGGTLVRRPVAQARRPGRIGGRPTRPQGLIRDSSDTSQGRRRASSSPPDAPRHDGK